MVSSSASKGTLGPLCEALCVTFGEFTQARDHFQLVRDLDVAHASLARAFNQPQTFQHLTKAYDQNKSVVETLSSVVKSTASKYARKHRLS